MKKILLLLIILTLTSCNKNNSSDNSLPAQTPHKLISWGANRQGQMGNEVFSQMLPQDFPYQLKITNPKQITTGLRHSVVLDEDGQVWVWGENEYGQLGLGNLDNQASPQKIPTLPKIVYIATNQHHSLAIDETGQVWAWGLNLSGQLGNGNNQNQPSPVKISNLEQIVQVAAGYRFSLAINNEGKTFAWGAQCPTDIPETTEQHPRKPSLEEIKQDEMNENEKEENDEDYYDPVDSDIYKTNDLNNCRNQENVNIYSLTPKLMDTIPTAKQLAAGFGHALILTQTGEIWSWGCNFYGQVGREKLGNSPALSVPGLITNLSHITQIAAGFRHSLALDAQGNVWVWGHNEFGELGIEDKHNIPLPQVISFPQINTIKIIAAGYDTSVIITQEQKLFVWGQNQYNQLSSSEPDHYYDAPQLLEYTKDLPILDVSAGGGHLLAITQ